MYVLPFVAIFLIALAIFFSPLLAVVLFVLAAAAIGGAKFFGGSGVVDQQNAAADAPQAEIGQPSEAPEGEGGIWGETWPEQREQRHGS